MTTGKSILLVEDETDLADVLRFHLKNNGYDCRWAPDGQTALTEARRAPPDLLIVDRMLPKLSGDELCTRLKRDPRCGHIPILMLTAKAEEADELVGFALGADDYVRKPFSMKLLLARVAALLRREQPGERVREVMTHGPIVLDRARHEVTVDGRPVTLTATEFGILATLMAAEGRVLNRGQLIDSVLGSNVAVSDRTIDVHIAALRKKLGDASASVQTVRGVGYTLRAPAQRG